MNKTTDITAVLLDLDGTLLDTAPDLVATVNQMRLQHCEPELPSSELRHLASYGARGMLGRGFDVTPDDERYPQLRDRFLDLYRQKMTELSQPFPGTREVLRQIVASGLQWGVVTNKYESLAVPLMQAMAFEPPPGCVVGGDSAAYAKPHPAPLFLACEQMGLEPASCIYVGDSDRDIEAGRAAGMRTIAAAYGYIPPDADLAQWKADIVIDDIRKLADAVTQLQSKQS